MKTKDKFYDVLESTEKFVPLLKEYLKLKISNELAVEELTKEQTYIAHKFEDKNSKYRDRAKLSTKYKKVRIERRLSKDWLAENKAVIDYLQSDKGSRMLNLLAEFCGVLRKVNKCREKRLSSTPKWEG